MALAFFDVAGTLVAGNSWRGLLKSDKIAKSRLVMLYPFLFPAWYGKKLKLISDARFRQIWIRQMAWLLKGLPRSETEAIFRWIAAEFMADDYREDVVARLKAHKANGDRVFLVSGMFTGFTQAFADYLGADAGLGTELGYDDNDICTGQIIGEGCAGELKPLFLQRYLDAHGIDWQAEETFAYADSFSDVPLLAMADHATATYPDEGLQAVVAERGWALITAEAPVS